MVNCGGVSIDGGRGLGAQVAVAGVEIESADVVGAAGAGELHSALDASDGVVSLHNSSVVVSRENGVHVSRAAKVTRTLRQRISKSNKRFLTQWESQRAEGPRGPKTYNCWRGKLVSGGNMEGWKKAVVAGSIGAAAVLFLKKKYPAGVLVTGVGLAVVASEFPDKFDKVRRALPDYFDRGMQVMEMAARAGKRITDAAGQSAYNAWDEIGG